jgi:hypothetical protein
MQSNPYRTIAFEGDVTDVDLFLARLATARSAMDVVPLCAMREDPSSNSMHLSMMTDDSGVIINATFSLLPTSTLMAMSEHSMGNRNGYGYHHRQHHHGVGLSHARFGFNPVVTSKRALVGFMKMLGAPKAATDAFRKVKAEELYRVTDESDLDGSGIKVTVEKSHSDFEVQWMTSTMTTKNGDVSFGTDVEVTAKAHLPTSTRGGDLAYTLHGSYDPSLLVTTLRAALVQANLELFTGSIS